MITKTKEWFDFHPFQVVNDQSKHFSVKENMVYISPKDDIFNDEREVLSFYNWNLWEISNETLKRLVGEFVDSAETIGDFLVLSKWNYFWIINTFLDKVFSYYWNLYDIQTNDENSNVWFVVGRWSEIFFYSNKGGMIISENQHSEINRGIVVLYDEEIEKYEGYNEYWNMVFSQIGGRVIFEDSSLLLYDEISGYWCYSYLFGKMILEKDYDMIYSRANYIVGIKDNWYTILHQIHWKLLEWVYDDVTPQEGFLIIKSNEDYLLLDCEWKVVMEGKKFMYIDDKKTIHTYSPKWDKTKKIKESYLWLF